MSERTHWQQATVALLLMAALSLLMLDAASAESELSKPPNLAACIDAGRCVPGNQGEASWGHYTNASVGTQCDIVGPQGPFNSEAEFVQMVIEVLQPQYDAKPACGCSNGEHPMVHVTPAHSEYGDWANVDGGERLCTEDGEMCPKVFEGTKIESFNNRRYRIDLACGDQMVWNSTVTVKRRHKFDCPDGSTGDTLDSGERVCLVKELKGSCNGGRDAPPANHAEAVADLELAAFIGNPTNLRDGNKVRVDADYVGTGTAPLHFIRTYNSASSVGTSTIGAQWRHSYERRLEVAADGATGVRGDGAQWPFMREADGSYRPHAGVRTTLIALSTDHPAFPEGHELAFPNGTIERYDIAGRLREIVQRNGLTTTLTYNASSELLSVTGPFGHQLMFEYVGGRLVRLIDPGSEVIHFRYQNEVLTEVEYPHPDGVGAGPPPTRQYLYEDALFPRHLTGIVDERGVRIRTYSYDLSGRVASSEGADIGHGVGLGRYAFDYGDGGMTTVTGPRGARHQRWFDVTNGRSVVSRGRTGDTRGASEARHDDQLRRTQIVDPLGGRSTTGYPNERTRVHTEAAGSPLERVTVTEYLSDTLRLPVQIMTPSVAAGRSTEISISYSASGQPESIMRGGYRPDGTPVERTSGFTYYGSADGVSFVSGLLKSTDGPRTDASDITTLRYHDCNTGGACGQLAAVTDAADHQTTYDAYDAHGRVTRMTAPSELVTEISYDLRGRLRTRTETAPGSAPRVTRYEYDESGGLVEVTTADGVTAVLTPNTAGDTAAVEDPAGNRQVFGYDESGNLEAVEIIDPAGTVVSALTHSYDPRDRRISSAIGGSVSEWRYDDLGRVITATDPRGGNTRQSYDALGRLIRTVNPERGTIRFSYDVNDQLVAVTDPESRTTRYAVDDLGNRLSEQSPARGDVTYEHDAAGNLISRTDARGVTVSYEYDALNRLVLVDYPTDPDVVLEYDGGLSSTDPNARGKLTRIERADSVIAYDYDTYGNIVRDARTITGNTYVTAYGYDAGGRLERITYPSGTVLWYRYDVAGRIHRVDLDTGRGPVAFLEDITYRPFGPMTAALAGNGLALVRDFDERGLPANISVHPPLGAPALLDRDYAVDVTGNIEAIDDFVEPLSSEDFPDGYDALDRLVAADGPYGIRTYEYDRVGNRKRIRYDASLPELAPKPALADLAFEYDEQGRIALALAGGGVIGEYRYNVLGQRKHKAAGGRGTAFVFGLSGELLAEADDGGTIEREYLYLNGRLIGVVDTGVTPAIYWVHTDHLGTPRMMADAVGAMVWETVQAPFGAVQETTGLGGLNVRFPGQYFDAETAAHYNYHRFYDPRTGRYTRSDPIGLDGGINTISYALQNPIALIDPLGLMVGGPCDPVANFGANPPPGYCLLEGGGTKGFGGGPTRSARGSCPKRGNANRSAMRPEIASQKQAGHVPGTPQNANRRRAGKPTSTFFGPVSADWLTREAFRRGELVPGRGRKVIEHDFGVSVGVGPGGGVQTRVRVHIDKKGRIHGHPSGPEKH